MPPCHDGFPRLDAQTHAHAAPDHDPEIALWLALRSCRLAGARFRRQHPIGPWIVDFYCAEKNLAIEVDGQGHDYTTGYDARRDADLARRGMRVIRVAAIDVLRDVDAVVTMIEGELGA